MLDTFGSRAHAALHIICYEDTHETALSCASGHAVCNGCFGPYLHERAGALGKTDLLASKEETAEL